ncbi:hypothetical protein CQ009_12945 [Pseudomonas sp. MYb2]|uniref:hypothetical protein n=1 Tax=unclassified Pseudomonas TaxID=196821 RepID=UPI000D001E12|nr:MULTISPECIES: hypothetical protein [unclassified Pseudomonas]PRB51185.1 hypothetical protein CQ025_09590 [Pseudomonas sp. MYb3]PRC34564.1 hypothetical protein CQ009_12945 [Pseudomonas sp. MYb2]
MSENFKNLRRHSGMSEGSAEAKREAAVAAALTLIQSKVSNSPTNGAALDYEMSSLSKYADQIQEALKVK